MTTSIANYDGSIVSTPRVFVEAESVEHLQTIMRDRTSYPGPVRAVGSNHSLTPCASSPGTMVSTKRLNRIIRIDPAAGTFTAQAGLEIVDAARALRAQNLQFMLNIEIGNLTLGSAACTHTKDALDGVEFGQVNSYVTAMKWVTPSGELDQASEETSPEKLALMRGSYGLAGIVYEVTFRIKPLEIIRFTYRQFDVAKLTQAQVAEIIAANQAMVCWTIGPTVTIQTRNLADRLQHDWFDDARRFGWNFLAAFLSRAIRRPLPGSPITTLIEDVGLDLERGLYRLLGKGDGFTLHGPDKTVNYRETPPSARYAFTFWAFPRDEWVKNLQDYVVFAERHYAEHGFRCNMPLGSYFVRRDTHSILSYTADGDVISLDPIHAPSGPADQAAWDVFLRAFNDWSHARGGRPLLNQSPFVTRAHVVAAYGDRWKRLCDWVREQDPDGRLLNPFFSDLLA
jgi:FAD/FMN-containing dehydrogenase